MGKASRRKKLAVTHPESALPLLLRNPDFRFRETIGSKLSEIVLRFGEHYLPEPEDEDEYRDRFARCVIAWNLSLVPTDERHTMLMRATSSYPGAMRAEMIAEISTLIARKETLFSEDRRFIQDYELSFTDKSVALSVASSPIPKEA